MSEKVKKTKSQKQPQKKDDKPKNQNKNSDPQKKNDNKSKNIDKSQTKPVPLKETKLKNETKTPISDTPMVISTEQTSGRGKYSKRKVESNWEKMELPENIYETIEDSTRGANMGELLRKPISIGEHFQFKHEKFWNFDSKSRNDNDLFTLDMKTIAKHISCIPFYERNDLDRSLFSTEEIHWMDSTASINKMSFDTSSNKYSEVGMSNLMSAEDIRGGRNGAVSPQKNLKSPDISTIKGSKTSPTVENDELDQILNASLNLSVPDVAKNIKSDVEKSHVKGTVTENEDDLEDWLDEYLGT